MLLMTAGEGKGVGEILRCQFSKEFQNSIVLHNEKDGQGSQILQKGKYLLFLIPRWNSVACSNTEHKQVKITVQSPVATQLRPALPEVGLREITKLLH